MVAVSQTLSNAFSWMKMLEFRLKFHWSLFLRVQLTIFQHWFRKWLGADQATSHYLTQWWLAYRCIYASLGLNELIVDKILTIDTVFHLLIWIAIHWVCRIATYIIVTKYRCIVMCWWIVTPLLHSISQPSVHPCFARAIELIAHPKITKIFSFSWGFSSKVAFCTP